MKHTGTPASPANFNLLRSAWTARAALSNIWTSMAIVSMLSAARELFFVQAPATCPCARACACPHTCLHARLAHTATSARAHTHSPYTCPANVSIVGAYIGMAYIVMACIVMACVVMQTCPRTRRHFLRGETNATLEHLFKIFVQRSFELWKARCPPKLTISPSTFTSCRLLNYHGLCGAYFRGPQIMSI